MQVRTFVKILIALGALALTFSVVGAEPRYGELLAGRAAEARKPGKEHSRASTSKWMQTSTMLKPPSRIRLSVREQPGAFG